MFKKMNANFLLSFTAGLLSVSITHSAWSLTLSQSPLFLAQPVKPLVMLNMSNDHQLYFKAYDDYTDLDDDGIADTTYMNDYDYYGYFDSNKCYSYESNRFVPKSWATNSNGDTAEEINALESPSEADAVAHYCLTSLGGEWSGNFLNWLSMTRMDAVRKILYGGFRSFDESSGTVLERAYLPHDAHSFAKYYNKADVAKLTPFDGLVTEAETAESGITFCNTTPDSNNEDFSQDITSAPSIRVAKGNFSLWASNERWQCRWSDNISDSYGVNGNTYDSNTGTYLSGIPARSYSPSENSQTIEGECIRWRRGQCQERAPDIVIPADKLGEFDARVEVCSSGLLEENCRPYPGGNSKPSGLLQRYGENGEIHFGLLTGSYSKNKSGGVLRKNVSDFSNEINVDTDGTFKEGVAGIVSTVNALRIYGYGYDVEGDDGDYRKALASNGDNCDWGWTSFSDGQCSNWGNPQSEIYLESLRYLAGKGIDRPTGNGDETTTYNVSGDDKLTGLTAAAWVAPITNDNYCANTSIIQFNASSSSYDGDVTNDLGIDIAAKTRTVGNHEIDSGKTYFVGTSGDQDNQLCTAKSISDLSQVTGTCPDAPRLGGTYNIAGMAYHARSEGITGNFIGAKTVTTYGVALAPAVPKVEIPVPGTEGQFISILPACRNNMGSGSGNCAIVDFKIIEQEFNVAENTGKLYVNWEDSEQGGDYDQDMWGTISYKVTGSTVTVTTDVISDSTSSSFRMGFGYVIGGTQTDGFHAHSGIYGFTYDSGKNDSSCSNCQRSNGPTTASFDIGTSSSISLESPLYYAAKWGGYGDKEDGSSLTAEEIAALDPQTYFYAIEPSELEESLSNALDQVAAAAGAASSVATNSTRLGTNTVVYQAMFDSGKWFGTISAQELKSVESEEEGVADKVVLGDTLWKTQDSSFAGYASRKVSTSVGGVGTAFSWDNLDAGKKDLLKGEGGTDADGQNVVDWVLGKDVDGLRDREAILGDVVNSSPVFSGKRKFSFHKLPSTLGGDKYIQYYNEKINLATRKDVLFVGANDGMLHAFDAANGKELFAYVPSPVVGKLKRLSQPNYGSNNNAHTYTVDGPIFVGDAYVGNEWKKILVGTMGAGARGLFVLDVTDPANFNPAQDVLFEITETDFPQIGNITGQPVIAPTTDGWKIFVGNGYNSDGEPGGQASLFVIDLDTPLTQTAIIPVGAGGDNGLAGPALLTNGYGVVVTAYAGDLTGNMWKFDVSGANTAEWGVALKDAEDNDLPLFTALDDKGNPQKITSAPTLGPNQQMDNAIMVYFGTGSYLTAPDNDVGSVVNSFYALADQHAPIAGRIALFEKVISSESDTSRQVSNDSNTDWWKNKKGWYIDLALGEGLTGERVISKPLLQYDRLLFPTLIPSAVACAFGGSGWQMELKAVGDRFGDQSIFGQDGIKSDYAIIGYSNTVEHGDKIYLPTNNIKGELDVPEGDVPFGAKGRMSWRQIR